MVKTSRGLLLSLCTIRILKATGDGTEAGTTFDGSESDVTRVKASIRHKVSVSLGAERRSPEAAAGYDSPIALTAALFSVSGPDTVLLRAPKGVTNLIGYTEESPLKDEFALLLEEAK